MLDCFVGLRRDILVLQFWRWVWVVFISGWWLWDLGLVLALGQGLCGVFLCGLIRWWSFLFGV